MTEPRLHDYLCHMRQAVQDALSFVEGLSKDEFLADKRTQQAVIMSLLIVGEASSRSWKPMQVLSKRMPIFLAQHARDAQPPRRTATSTSTPMWSGTRFRRRYRHCRASLIACCRMRRPVRQALSLRPGNDAAVQASSNTEYPAKIAVRKGDAALPFCTSDRAQSRCARTAPGCSWRGRSGEVDVLSFRRSGWWFEVAKGDAPSVARLAEQVAALGL